jgi:hypothetical protein
MARTYTAPSIDEYLRKRLMPVEGAIPHVQGIEMYGNSVPAGTVGGDIFEYINFQQRYDIDARIERALKRSKEYLEPLPPGNPPPQCGRRSYPMVENQGPATEVFCASRSIRFIAPGRHDARRPPPGATRSLIASNTGRVEVPNPYSNYSPCTRDASISLCYSTDISDPFVSLFASCS